MTETRSSLFTPHATKTGGYWTSPASPDAVRHYLRGYAVGGWKTAAETVEWWEDNSELKRRMSSIDPAALFKRAAIGGEEEEGFEQAFSSLAYAYVKDAAPRLLDFIVGFQLVDRNEDNTKAVGIFGFKAGDQWLYAPVFFLNGDLKGHELLYIKKQDMFVPLKENWVNYLISRRPHTLGEGSDDNTYQLGGLMPNITRLSRPPAGTKYGAADRDPLKVAEWAHDVMPLLAASKAKLAAALYGPGVAGDLNIKKAAADPFRAALASVAATFDLHTALTSFPLLKMAYDQSRKYPLIKAGFDKFYGTDFFAKTATRIKAAAVRGPTLLDKAAGMYKPLVKAAEVSGEARAVLGLAPRSAVKKAEITVYAVSGDGVSVVKDDVPITDNIPELTDEQREKLIKDNVLIRDERSVEGRSTAYNVQTRLEMVNPSDTGLYEVLEKPGNIDQMVVIANPHSGRGREDFCVVMRKASPRNWKNIHRTHLWAKSCDCPVPSEWREYVKGLDGVDSCKEGSTYVAVNENGSGTCPFTVTKKYEDGVMSVDWKDTCDYSFRPNQSKDERPFDWEVGYTSWNARIYLTDQGGQGLRSVNGELHIPETYKIIKIAGGTKDDDGADTSETEPIAPGNLIDIQVMLHKKASVMKLHEFGSEVIVNSPKGTQRLSKTAALVSLVRDHGLGEDQAREMLKRAAARAVVNEAAPFRIKYADGYGDSQLQPGPTAPQIPEALRGVEQHGPNSTSSIYPQEEFLPVESLQNRTDPAIYDPFYEPDPKAIQTAQQASASGQKEVFDTAMIGGLLKGVRQDTMIDRYLGDLMKAIDKLGRILFLFYWHQEEFADRYGKEDLPELEDSLRNAFESLGDVTLFLKEKTVQGKNGLNVGTGAGVGPNKDDPDISEAAHN